VDPKGIISLWGAVYNLAYIEPSVNVPTMMVHGTADFIVPYTEGRPFTGQFPSTFPYVYGSTKMDARFAANNTYREFYSYQGLGHVLYGIPSVIVTFPNQYWSPVWNQGKNFLLKIMGFNTPIPTGNLAAVYNSTTLYTVPSTKIGSTFCWTVTGGTVLTYTNGGKTANIRWNASGVRRISVTETDAKQMAGNAVTINIGAAARFLNPKNILAQPILKNTLTVFPNPFSMGTTFNASLESTENATATCAFMDITGKVVASFERDLTIGTNNFVLPSDALSPGIYLLNVQTATNRETVKVIVQ
jgi:hypothetical protein